jgi:protease-4
VYIDYSVWSAGEYKSFTEPYTRDDMSPADREASALYLDVLWREYSADVVAARGLDEAAMNRLASEFSSLLRMANGDAAQMALDFGLVDELMTRGEVNQHLAEIVGTQDERNEQFAGIGFTDYLGAVRDPRENFGQDNKLAVLTLAGQIYDGNQAPGSVGGDSTAQLVRQARQDENVKALVLRVDSPGGSAFASEIILNELEAFQATDRPLVVSMGSVAASGGYWVSMTADEIWASATTITGSIGVGALVPTFPRALDRLGIHIDGIGTNRLAGQFSVLRGIGEDADQYYAQSVSNLYEQFVAKVSEGRDREQAEIESVAQGRVWAGTHALDSGLVDQLGSLDDAIRSAAGLAGLESESYRVEYVERELSFSESLALQFAQAVSPVLEYFSIDAPWSASIKRVVEAVLDPVEFLERQNDPRGLYSYCFCDVQ